MRFILLGLVLMAGSLGQAAGAGGFDRGECPRMVFVSGTLNLLAPGAKWNQPTPKDLENARRFLEVRYADVKKMDADSVLLSNLDSAYIPLALAVGEKFGLRTYPFLDLAFAYYRYGPKTSTGKPLADEVRELAGKYRGSRWLGGFYTFDEPTLEELDRLEPYHAALLKVWPEVVLCPCIVGWDRNLRYIEKFKPNLLMYDSYPFHQGTPSSCYPESPPGDVSITFGPVDHWGILDAFRAKLAADAKVWLVVQAWGLKAGLDKGFNKRIPSEAELKLQVYGAMALGAGGYCYFCYESPGAPSWVTMVEGPGRWTHLGRTSMEINGKVKALWPILRRYRPLPAVERDKLLRAGRPHVVGVFADPTDKSRLAVMAVNGVVLAAQTVNFKVWLPEGQKVVAAASADGQEVKWQESKAGYGGGTTFNFKDVPPGDCRVVLLTLGGRGK